MSERQFFHYEDVKITNTRFVNGAQTYAMSNVTSVKSFEQKPKRLKTKARAPENVLSFL